MLLLNFSKMINTLRILSLVLLCMAQARSSEQENQNYEHYPVELKTLETFQEDCNRYFLTNPKGKQEAVIVFGTGHYYYDDVFKTSCPKNFYLADTAYKTDSKPSAANVLPDLVMSAGVEELPNKFHGQFNVVVFEGIGSGINYERDKAFLNACLLLKDDGILLLQCESDEQEQKEILLNYFLYVNIINELSNDAEHKGYFRTSIVPFGRIFIAKK